MEQRERQVVVTGLGMVLPIGLDTRQTWRSIVDGVSGIGSLSRFDASGCPSKVSAEVAHFDVEGELRNPKNEKFLGRSARMVIRAANEAWRSSRAELADLDPYKLGVYLGSGQTGVDVYDFFKALSYAWRSDPDRDYRHLGGRAARLLNPYFSLRTLSNGGVGLLSMELQARGPSQNFVHSDTASAHAVAAACRDLSQRRCDLALVGGYDCLIYPSTYLAYEQKGLLSRLDPSEAHRPFDLKRDGIALGEGAVILVLERKDSAALRGATVLGDIQCCVFSTDPSVEDSQSNSGARCLWRALKDLPPPSFAIARGLGTRDHDAREVAQLNKVLHGTPVTAFKSHTGYLGAATAAAEIGLGLLGLRNHVIPPILRHRNTELKTNLDFVLKQPRILAANETHSFVSLDQSWGGEISALVVSEGDLD